MPFQARPAIDRFMERFTPEPNSGCWIWTGAVKEDGYGLIALKKRKQVTAHRWAWEHFNDRRVPLGMCVLHRCDVPACVNPKHLWIGTQAENVADMIKKGRRVQPDSAGSTAAIRARAAAQTHCLRGHEYNEANTYRWSGNGRRRCRKCAALYQAMLRALARA